MKGNYAGKSHAHRDEKKEQKKRGPDEDHFCVFCLDPEQATVVYDSLDRPVCVYCLMEIIYDD